ncbi:MAG TPA: ETX/MTX2 family pore-forming toxin, partial [Solirubrobacteraceae bacterium]|nr:ETX/MTX2 family pore-forming toxin [Solirubrobacteraceae bacterium]
ELSTELDYTYTWDGSETITKKWSWKQPIVVPAHTTVRADTMVSQSTLAVPYTMCGSFEFANGQKAGAMQEGMYEGVNSHDLAIRIRSLAPSPAAAEAAVALPGLAPRTIHVPSPVTAG